MDGHGCFVRNQVPASTLSKETRWNEKQNQSTLLRSSCILWQWQGSSTGNWMWRCCHEVEASLCDVHRRSSIRAYSMSLCFALCQQNTRDCMRTYDEFACLQPANQRHAMPRQQTTECIQHVASDDAFHLHMLWNCCLKVSVEGNAWPRRENGFEEHVSKFLKDQEKALVSIRHFYAFLLLSLKLGQGLASRCFPSRDNQRQVRFFPKLMTVKYKIRIYHSSLMEICGFERTSRFETSRQSRQNRQRRKSTCHPKSMCMRKMFRGDANAPAVLALKSKIHGYLDEVPIAVTNRAGPSILQIAVTRLPAIGGLWSSGSSGPLKIVSRLFRLFGCRYWLALHDAARLRSWRNPWTRKRRVRYFQFGL